MVVVVSLPPAALTTIRLNTTTTGDKYISIINKIYKILILRLKTNDIYNKYNKYNINPEI